jgi:hypothetical protein
MNTHPQLTMQADVPTLLSAVTIIDKTRIGSEDRDFWDDLHQQTQARLLTSVAKFYLDHRNVTVLEQPAYCSLEWAGDADAVGYVLSAVALRHTDLSHALASDDDPREGEWIRLRTLCECESRTIRYPSPLPRIVVKQVGNRARAFARGARNAFGATVYHEVVT